ncbi:RNA-binding S4 domain-containing protein [Anaerolineales bacterium HSG24]|nr:RNA-binding S4 domain-containing protein [Anaerolineales bacterium HSG24]
MRHKEPIIQLDQFLKRMGLVSTGGQAKIVIQAGDVLLNGVVETRRKKKLKSGDEVTFQDETYEVAFQ